jgi:hypothetical protein
MTYTYAVRGWLELSWPDIEFEGVDETPAEHDAKIARVRALLTPSLSREELLEDAAPPEERLKAAWSWPQQHLGGTEYMFFGTDMVEAPKDVLALIQQVLAIDPFADGYFSVEGEDGEQFRQWLILSGKIHTKRELFPDFDGETAPGGYVLVFDASSSETASS